MTGKAPAGGKREAGAKAGTIAKQGSGGATASDAPRTTNTEKVVSDTAVYGIRADRPITLKVTIGDAQVGGTTLRLNGVPVPFPNQQKAVEPGLIASPSVLDCVSLVRDVNPATNRTSVSYELSGGVEPRTFTYALEASEKGQVRYEISFLLV